MKTYGDWLFPTDMVATLNVSSARHATSFAHLHTLPICHLPIILEEVGRYEMNSKCMSTRPKAFLLILLLWASYRYAYYHLIIIVYVHMQDESTFTLTHHSNRFHAVGYMKNKHKNRDIASTMSLLSLRDCQVLCHWSSRNLTENVAITFPSNNSCTVSLDTPRGIRFVFTYHRD